MKKSRLRIGALIMKIVIAVGLLMPLSSYCQGGKTDGFFSNSNTDYENRANADVSVAITNDSFGAPLGSGLMIMTVACVGYLLLKKRRRAVTMLVLLVIMLGMTQCKKRHVVVPNDDGWVNITLDVGNSTKVDVNTGTGAVKFEDGDEILVGNYGVYVGKLTCNDGVFSGNIRIVKSNTYLYFYYLGNIEVNDLTVGSTKSCSVNISDQVTSLPVISCGRSTQQYSSGISTYEAHLKNKCALVKFNITSDSPYASTCITGMSNKVTLNFESAAFTPSVENAGEICLAPGSGEKWAILLPQGAVGEGGEGSAFAGRYKGHRNAVPEIHEDDYLDAGIDVVMDSLMRRPTGTLRGFFTVNADGKQVMFSKANLSYVKGLKEWRFLDNQYETVETNGGVGTDYTDKSVVTLFEWGQSGHNHGAVSYLPYDTRSNQKYCYAYGDPTCNLYDHNGLADWGYNAITNGGRAYKQWRTLTLDEWMYIFTQRDGAANKYGRATIDDTYKGIVVLPDNWVQPAGIGFTGGSSATFADNPYTVSEWNEMEKHGAAFFPLAGYRSNTNVSNQGVCGRLWSSTAKSNGSYAYAVDFTSSSYNFNRSNQRHQGLSVRLACE